MTASDDGAILGGRSGRVSVQHSAAGGHAMDIRAMLPVWIDVLVVVP